MKGYRPLQTALRDRLQAELPGRLAAVLGDSGTQIPLREPAVYRLHATAEEAEYPVIFILPGEATPREQTGRWLTSVRELMVVVEMREENVERLGEALTLYEVAVLEACLGTQAPPPAHGIAWTRTQPGPVFELEQQPVLWQSWMQMTFELTLYEEDRIA